MFKRIGLFLGLNFVVLMTISVLVKLLGVDRWLTANGIDYAQLLQRFGERVLNQMDHHLDYYLRIALTL